MYRKKAVAPLRSGGVVVIVCFCNPMIKVQIMLASKSFY